MEAIDNGHAEIVRLILGTNGLEKDHRYKLLYQQNNGVSPLYAAVSGGGHLEIFQFILGREVGLDPDQKYELLSLQDTRGQCPFIRALCNNHKNIMYFIFLNSEVNLEPDQKIELLSRNNQMEYTKWMMCILLKLLYAPDWTAKQKFNLFSRIDQGGKSPLISAVSAGSQRWLIVSFVVQT